MDVAILALIAVTCFLALFFRLVCIYNLISQTVTDRQLNQLKRQAARIENSLAVVGGIAIVFLIFMKP